MAASLEHLHKPRLLSHQAGEEKHDRVCDGGGLIGGGRGSELETPGRVRREFSPAQAGFSRIRFLSGHLVNLEQKYKIIIKIDAVSEPIS